METSLQPGELARLNAELAQLPSIEPDRALRSTVAQRLRKACRDAVNDEGAVGSGDIAALLRHALCSAKAIGDPAMISIPQGSEWPSDEVLNAHGMNVSCLASNLRHLTPRAWNPGWLGPEAGNSDPAEAVFRGSRARSDRSLPADPFFHDATGGQFGGYLSPGQREAVRTLALSPPGASIIAALPTGSGKSVVAYLPALMQRSGLVVVVVPTTALAIDQERAFRELVEGAGRGSEFPRELAYHGELADELRADVRLRIAAGSQRIVFTSPESLVGSLASSLFKAAGSGSLNLFAVDEAHIVDEWGADFRPEFQQLGAFRDALNDASPTGMKSLFLSGTFTDDTIYTLRRLFGSESEYIVAAMDLRAEPSYWPAFATSPREREEWVLEAVRHLPRPLILYVTTQEDVARWGDRLRSCGYLRSAIVSGATEADRRREVIQMLRGRDLDLVVANSAFGLGVDQPDIRAVVHACIPETLNRYYQEVGRGGRDGCPSISMMIACEEDRPVAKKLAHATLISEEKGRPRWELMIGRGVPSPTEVPDDPRYKVPIDVVPPWLPGDSDENRAWNLRTLLLMDRAGMIQVHTQPPPRLPPEASDEDWRSTLDEHGRHAVVSIVAKDLATDDGWEPFRRVRELASGTGTREHSRVLSVFERDHWLCAEFVDTYTLTGVTPEAIPPGRTCAGCPGCRAERCVPRLHPLAMPSPTDGLPEEWSEELGDLFSGEHVLVVSYRRKDWPGRISSAVGRLPNVGVRSLYAGDALSGTMKLLHLAHGPVCVSDLSYVNLTAPRVPTAILLDPDLAPSSAHVSAAGPRRLLFCEEGMPHPDHPTETIVQYSPSAISLDEFLARF